MSPEQALNHEIDRRSDLWSVAVILFRAVTGRRPFGGVGLLEAVVEICTAPIPRATDFNPDLPPEMDAFFERALARDPAQRFQSAREMAQTFAQYFRGPNTSWPPPAGEAVALGAPNPARSSWADAEQAPTIAELAPAPPGARPAGDSPTRVPAKSDAVPEDVEPLTLVPPAPRRRLAIAAVVVVLGLAVALLATAAFDSAPEPSAASSAAPSAAPPPSSEPVRVAAPEPPPAEPAVAAPSVSSEVASAGPRRRTATAARTVKRTAPAPSAAPPKKKRDLGY
jgi:serine/threonine-protein kinase